MPYYNKKTSSASAGPPQAPNNNHNIPAPAPSPNNPQANMKRPAPADAAAAPGPAKKFKPFTAELYLSKAADLKVKAANQLFESERLAREAANTRQEVVKFLLLAEKVRTQEDVSAETEKNIAEMFKKEKAKEERAAEKAAEEDEAAGFTLE